MTKCVLVLVACFAISPVAFGQSNGSAASGKALAEKWQCIACHGPDGNGNKGRPDFQRAKTPRISAQPPRYFIKSMSEYKSGVRPEEDMEAMAQQLSDSDIRDLAAWYGAQTPKAAATYNYALTYCPATPLTSTALVTGRPDICV